MAVGGCPARVLNYEEIRAALWRASALVSCHPRLSLHLKMGGGLDSTCRVLPTTCVVPYVPVGGSPRCLRPSLEAVPRCRFWRGQRPAHVPSPRVLPPVSTCPLIPHPVPWPLLPNLLARLPLALGGPDRQLHSCSPILRDGVSTGLSLHHQFCRMSIVLSTH